MITKVEGTLSAFLTNEQPKSAAKDTVGLPQPHNVTGGLDVQDMFKYFTLETSQKIYMYQFPTGTFLRCYLYLFCTTEL